MAEAPLPEDPDVAWRPVRRLFEAYRKRVATDDRGLMRRLENALAEVGVGRSEKPAKER